MRKLRQSSERKIAMSENAETTLTHHAMLVAWGQYAHGIGLVSALETVWSGLHSMHRLMAPGSLAG